MKLNIYETPVTIIIYNRSDKLNQLIQALRLVKPKNIYVIADGAKNSQDKLKVNKCRNTLKEIDWECSMVKNYSDINLGLRKRVETGLDWLFKNVDYSIILEDDCIPNYSFFKFMEQSLIKYRNHEEIYMVSGSNLYESISKDFVADYFLTQSALIWGWGTWSRAWNKYDADMEFWTNHKLRMKLFFKVLKASKSLGNLINFYRTYKRVYTKEISSWAFIWTATILLKDVFVITPKHNLVSNIGFGEDSTHTKDVDNNKSNLTTKELDSLNVNSSLKINNQFDKFFLRDIFGRPYIIKWFFRKLNLIKSKDL